MKSINIVRNGQITNSASFETQELLDNWYATHVDSFGEHEAVREDLTEQLEQEKQRQESLALLAATDFYIIREMDSGLACPPEVKVSRAEARLRIK